MIETKIKNKNQIIATVDEEDNSIYISIMINGNPEITLNISVDDEKALIRKWIGYDDIVDEEIYIDDLYEDESEDDDYEE